MKILVITKNDYLKALINSVKHIQKEWKFNLIGDIDELDSIVINTLDFVIVDYSIMTNRIILSKIMQVKKSIKTLVVNDRLKYNVEYDCDYCIKNYNRIRIANFQDLKLFFNHIYDFDNLKCQFQNKCNLMENIILSIVSHSKCYKYDLSLKRILKDNYYSQSLATKELVEITNSFKEENIPFSILDESTLEVLI